jgi:anti-sigma regulatory factor (Ser/Thr protein kinase)
MFVSLSRRSGSLLERLLRLIDSLELGEQDSERLADLFRMDHLATRMRRNSENLLVLAGQEPPRRWAEPVSLADVARASVSEIEQYDRVVMDLQPGLGVTGNAVADVVHLLAEIIENATTFSQKSTHVTVSGHSLRSGGVLINVIDSGMGMTEEQLAVLNWRLENPPAADVEVSRHMGLFAVAHLADRHGIRVRLRKATGAGLVAHVWLPEALISHDSKPTSWDRIRTERASAVIEAVTRAARFPQDPAAAVALAAAPFAAAPLAEAPLITASPEEAPGVTAPAAAPAAGAPAAGPSLGEAPAVTASPGEVPAGGTAALIAPAGEAPGAPQAGAQHVVVPEPRQRPREIRLPIFESVESDWFRARRRPPPRAGVPLDPHRAAPSWTSPSDEGWRAAETVLAPTVDGVTSAGLPRRTPKANLVPGSAGARENGPARAADSAEAISGRLAGFQQGSRRARAAARSAQSSDEQP